MIRGRSINLPHIMMRNLIMAHDQKQEYFLYGQCLTTIFEHFEILLTGTDKTLYSTLMEIDNKTLIKIKFVLNKDYARVSRDQIKAHAKKEHDKEEEQHVGSDGEFGAMFETQLHASSPEKASTNSCRSRMENHLT